jgi:hypothetical protein
MAMTPSAAPILTTPISQTPFSPSGRSGVINLKFSVASFFSVAIISLSASGETRFTEAGR